MNTRERFIETLTNFNTSVPTLKWEFGYWGKTLNNWYSEGLKRTNPMIIPSNYTTPSSSIYTRAWTCENNYVKPGEYPDGFAITGGGLYWPTQGLALDKDVKDSFGLDETQFMIDLNLVFYPMFETQTLEEDEKRLKYIDVDGVTRLFIKESATIPAGWEWPIKDRVSWEKLKEERLKLCDVKKRLPKDWEEKVSEYKKRDYPLGIGGYPVGFFGILAHLIGYENLFYLYYDEPSLVHDILSTFTDLWIAVFEEVLKDVQVDHMQIWEDISFGSGSMLSPKLMKEFMIPYYKRITGFLKEKGVTIILVDTDGDCMDIIPLFIEGGVTGIFPFEVNCGMDIMEVRKKFPKLAMMGGIPKSQIGVGKREMDKILYPVKEVLKTGGYIPFADHLVPPDVTFADFEYYRLELNQIIEA